MTDPQRSDERKISRRTLAAGAAWSVPVIGLASTAPAMAASRPTPTGCCNRVAMGTGHCANYPRGFLPPANFNGTSQQGNTCCAAGSAWETQNDLPPASYGCITLTNLTQADRPITVGTDYTHGYRLTVNCATCGINDLTVGKVTGSSCTPSFTGKGSSTRCQVVEVWFKAGEDAATLTFYLSCGACLVGSCNFQSLCVFPI